MRHEEDVRHAARHHQPEIREPAGRMADGGSGLGGPTGGGGGGVKKNFTDLFFFFYIHFFFRIFHDKMLIPYALALVDYYLLHFRFPHKNDLHLSTVWTYKFPAV